ncbi:hypothetical protein E5288_WYG008033 [Bos mutus]|uniref:Uncharacterized protein n=1 Tax=Bos mutus TaxID=72004 RepID=A0A6B0RTC9_9CETA|nr:hypothetical protein [Bos mutus]
MAKALCHLSVPFTVVPDAAVGYIMDNVDLVIVGAEGVVENGGIINKFTEISQMTSPRHYGPFLQIHKVQKAARVTSQECGKLGAKQEIQYCRPDPPGKLLSRPQSDSGDQVLLVHPRKLPTGMDQKQQINKHLESKLDHRGAPGEHTMQRSASNQAECCVMVRWNPVPVNTSKSTVSLPFQRMYSCFLLTTSSNRWTKIPDSPEFTALQSLLLLCPHASPCTSPNEF